MPDWIKEAIINRFDERSIQSEKIKGMEVIKQQLIEIEREIFNNLSEGDRQLVNIWLDLFVRMSSMQNEWLYTIGIQDGIHILVYLQLDKEYI